ncbi:Carboxypeptidase regulatory-like domain-containing protein [Natronoarchaeum philippinense]|uniref:Carboxypeptidase regulatory-like domain-containing protein n=1 Tax=Natronoarchaeum philippinense TaxID=558529 RepID=A0A285N8D2_NATPI|nr:LamG-like jellyroll fold domain-containing protein [Natronoarchaeum philippinense]SNZ05679.1 Carboxypeptidase regulatory-like domain-containing protein [Natronoarchaeum philippinense]
MSFDADTRAQVVQIGAVLLFAALILAMTGYQATVVPDQNAEVELSHSDQVQSGMVELRNAIVSPDSRTQRDVTVPLGTRYPERTLFINPAPPSGKLRTIRGEMNVSNVSVAGEAGDYWGSSRTFSTGLITYRPNYNELDDPATTVIEGSLVYNRFENAERTLADPTFIDGTRISLVALQGSVSASTTGSERISVYTGQRPTRTVSVTGEAAGENVTVSLPTLRSESDWAQYLDAADHVSDWSVAQTPGSSYGTLEIVFERLDESGQPIEYDLSVAEVGVGEEVESTGAAYVTPVGSGVETVQSGQMTDVTFEVRGEYDDPIADRQVNLSVIEGQGTLIGDDGDGQTVTATTDTEGRVEVTYVAGDDETGDVTIGASVSTTPAVGGPFDDTTATNASRALRVVAGGSGDSGAYAVEWAGDVIEVVPGEDGIDARATAGVDDGPVEFAVQNRSILLRNDAATADRFSDGNASFVFGVSETVARGSEWYAYVSSRGSGDRLAVRVLEAAGLLWDTQADWADSSRENGVVHAVFGDRQKDTIQLGYGTEESGLVGYWPLDDAGAAGVSDVSGSGNDGSQSGGLGNASGLFGTSAYDFDGSDDAVTVPHDESIEMSDEDAVTVSAWVKKDAAQSGWVAIAQKSDQSYNLQFENGNQPTFTIYDGDWNIVNSGVSLSNDQWHHVVGTYDGSEARIYVNGTLKGTQAVSGTLANASGSPLGIGENLATGGRNLDGTIDELRLYDRALSDAEVQALYGVQSGQYTSGWRRASRSLAVENLALTNVSASIGGGTITVTVESDTNGDGIPDETSDPVPIASYDTYDLDGLSTDADRFRLRVEMTGDTPTRSPVLSRVEVAEETVIPATFEVTDLGPATASPDERFNATVSVENTGDRPGNATVAYDPDWRSVAVVDQNLAHGTEIADTLRNELPSDYDVRALRTGAAIDEIDHHDVFVVQRFGNETVAAEFQQQLADADAGVVYLDQWDERGNENNYPSETYSDAIRRLANSSVRGDPPTYDDEFRGTAPPEFTVQQDHPIFDGVAGVGETITVHNAAEADRAWFSGYNGTTLATVRDQSGGAGGPSIAVNDSRGEVLLGAGRSNYVPNSAYTADSNQILANAVTYVDEQVARTETVQLDPGERGTVTFPTVAPSSGGEYAQTASTANGSTTESMTVTTAEQFGSFSGAVFDNATGNPITDAELTVTVDSQNYTATTDANGNYEVSGVPAGTHDVTVDTARYKATGPFEVTVQNGSTTTGVDVHLSPEPPEFESLSATANQDGTFFGIPYSQSVTYEYDVLGAEDVDSMTFTVFDADGNQIGTTTTTSPASPTTVTLDSGQLQSVTARVEIDSAAGQRCLEGSVAPGSTISRSSFSSCG